MAVASISSGRDFGALLASSGVNIDEMRAACSISPSASAPSVEEPHRLAGQNASESEKLSVDSSNLSAPNAQVAKEAPPSSLLDEALAVIAGGAESGKSFDDYANKHDSKDVPLLNMLASCLDVSESKLGDVEHSAPSCKAPTQAAGRTA